MPKHGDPCIWTEEKGEVVKRLDRIETGMGELRSDIIRAMMIYGACMLFVGMVIAGLVSHVVNPRPASASESIAERTAETNVAIHEAR